MSNVEPPLLALPDFKPPGQPRAAWVKARDGVRLRTAVFPAAKPRGIVVLNTGGTEFIEKYYEVVGELLARSFTVLVHDWRGQGLSDRLIPGEPLKGHAVSADSFLSDFAEILNHYADLPRPWIALGHSMGGALTLLALLRGQTGFSATVLSSPMVGVNTSPIWGPAAALWTRTNVLVGRAQALVRPASDPLQDVFAGNPVTHDEARWTRGHALLVAHPELALNGATWDWLNFALRAGSEIRAGARKLSLPLAIAAAGAEQLADTAATGRFCAATPGAKFEEVQGAFHELLMEIDVKRAQFWALFDSTAAAAT